MSILVLTSDTLIGTPATGNLEYNGQFFGTDSNASRAQMQRITQTTVQATTSGTGPFPFTSIPSWVKRITVQFNGVLTNGSNLLVQIGSGSYTSSGYVSAGIVATSTGNTAVTTTAGFYSSCNLSSTVTNNGIVMLTNITGNTWVGTATSARSDSATLISSGFLALGGALDRLQLTTISGTATFSAGQVNILYEG